jgi:hypothetical protein
VNRTAREVETYNIERKPFGQSSASWPKPREAKL